MMFSLSVVHADQKPEDLQLRLRKATKKDFLTKTEIEPPPSAAVISTPAVHVDVVDITPNQWLLIHNKIEPKLQDHYNGILESLIKSCRSNIIDSCKQAGIYVFRQKKWEKMRSECSIDSASCSILGYAQIASGRMSEAKKTFKDLCRKNDFPQNNSWIICDEASKLIQLPQDAQAYIDLEPDCQTAAGETTIDYDDSDRDVASQVKDICKGRAENLENLKNKYRDNDDILFKLDYPPVL